MAAGIVGLLSGALWVAGEWTTVTPLPREASGADALNAASAAERGAIAGALGDGGLQAESSTPLQHPVTVAGGGARRELAQRMKADWCGFGVAEAQRQADEVTDRSSALTGTVTAEAATELGTTVGAEVLEEAMTQVRRRWGRALMQRGDVRSMALADFLGAGAGETEDQAARARAQLQARARTSSDPMVTALALQRPCAAGACVNIEGSQWSRLEPANLRAWVPLLLVPGADVGQAQAGYVLERLVAEARYARTYQREFSDALLSLPQTETPGLEAEAEVALIMGMAAAWHVPSMRVVLDICRSGAADGSSATRCEALAELLWQQGDLMDRAQSFSLARVLAQSRPSLRARWEPRARAYEAANAWTAGASERLAKEDAGRPGGISACAALIEFRQQLRAAVGRSEWDVVHAEMQQAGVDEAALSARWREGAGRSVLDPVPAVLAASRLR